MLHDLRGDYIRREEPGFFGRAREPLTYWAIWGLALLASAALLWASLKYGELPPASEPMGYFPWVTPGAE